MKIIKESKLNEKKSLEDTVYDELLDLDSEVYLSNLYDGYRVEVETEEQKEKVKKVAKKHKLETKEMGHKGYTDIHVIIPDEEEFNFDEELEESAGHRVETGFIGVPDIEDAQSIVNQAVELFKRVPAGLYDDLDAAGFYVDANNKVHKKIEENCKKRTNKLEESKAEIKKWIDDFMSMPDLSSHISHEGKKVYRTYGTRAYYYLMCNRLGLTPRNETAYTAEAENDDFELDYTEGDIDLVLKNDKYVKVEENLKEDYTKNIDWNGGVQEITEEDYYNFLNIIPPIYWDRMRNNRKPSTETKEYTNIFMVGEPYSYDVERKKNLYTKFGMKDGKYYYLGLDSVERI